MKKLSILLLTCIMAIGFYGVFNETAVNAIPTGLLCNPEIEPCLADPGDDDDGYVPPPPDYEDPVIHVSTMPIYINAYEDQLSLPSCYVTDNINHSLSCNIDVSDVNVNSPGVYTIYINAHDYSWNYANEVQITVIVEYSGTFYNIMYNSDYDFNDDYIDYGDYVKVPYGSTVETDYCAQLGSSYVKVGTNKKGDFLYELDWHFGDKMYDYTSGDRFYDYRGELFNAHYHVYEIYDQCEDTKSFSKTITLDDSFKGSAVWTRNDTASVAARGFLTYDPYTQTSMYFNNYTEAIIYLDHDTINYIQDLIDEYGATETLQILEETLENPYVQVGVGVTVLVAAIVFFPELFASSATAMTWVGGLAIVGKYIAEFTVGEIIDNWIENIFDENSMQDNINHALYYGHGLRLEYSCVGYYSLIFGKPVSLETTYWNPGDGIERVTSSNEFGDIDFVSFNEYAQ